VGVLVSAPVSTPESVVLLVLLVSAPVSAPESVVLLVMLVSSPVSVPESMVLLLLLVSVPAPHVWHWCSSQHWSHHQPSSRWSASGQFPPHPVSQQK